MKTINIAEARQTFSSIVDDIRLGGDGVLICKYGHPAAMLVPYRPEGRPPAGGNWRDELGLRNDSFVLPAGFDEPLDGLWSALSAESGA